MASVDPGHGLGALQKVPIDLKIFQWKCPLQNENGLARSKMKTALPFANWKCPCPISTCSKITQLLLTEPTDNHTQGFDCSVINWKSVFFFLIPTRWNHYQQPPNCRAGLSTINVCKQASYPHAFARASFQAHCSGLDVKELRLVSSRVRANYSS